MAGFKELLSRALRGDPGPVGPSPPQVEDLDLLRQAIAADRFLLFKHSHACSVSHEAFREYQKFHLAHPEVLTGWIDVIDQRPWSQQVATEAGVTHKSPQALLFDKGEVVWDASHWNVTEARLSAAVFGEES